MLLGQMVPLVISVSQGFGVGLGLRLCCDQMAHRRVCRLAFVPGRPAGHWLCSTMKPSLWLGSQSGRSLQPLDGSKTVLCTCVGVIVRMWLQAVLHLGRAAGWALRLLGSLFRLPRCAGPEAVLSSGTGAGGALPESRGCPSRSGFLHGWDWRLCLAVEQGCRCALLPGGAIERAHSWLWPLPGDLGQALRWAVPVWDLYLRAAAGRSAVH